MGFVRDASGSHRYGPSSSPLALLSAFGVTHEWRADLAGGRTIVAGKVSALSDNGAPGGWGVAQATAGQRPALEAGPPDGARFSVGSSTYLDTANSIDPNATFTFGCVFDATGNASSSIQTIMSFYSSVGQQRWMLGCAGFFNLAILRRIDDGGANTQSLQSIAPGMLYLAGKMVVTAGPVQTMSMSTNGANFADPKTPASAFTNSAMHLAFGAGSPSGALEFTNDKAFFGWAKQGDTSNADALAIYNTLHAVFG